MRQDYIHPLAGYVWDRNCGDDVYPDVEPFGSRRSDRVTQTGGRDSTLLPFLIHYAFGLRRGGKLRVGGPDARPLRRAWNWVWLQLPGECFDQ